MPNVETTASFLTAQVFPDAIQPHEISLFPTEATTGFHFTQGELLELSSQYATLYSRLVEVLSSHVGAHFSLGAVSAHFLVRSAIVPITHFFMDRLIRLHHVVANHSNVKLSIEKCHDVAVPTRPEDFRTLAWSSFEFNQQMLCRLAPLYHLEVHPKKLQQSNSPSSTVLARPMRNNNYAQTLRSKTKRAIRWWVPTRCLSRISRHWSGRVPVLSMAYATPVLQEKGFYGFSGFSDINDRVHFDRFSLDQSLRQAVIRAAAEEINKATHDFLQAVGMTDNALQKRVTHSFEAYLMEYYPADLLEGIPIHWQRCQGVLQQHKARTILSSDYGDIAAVYFFAVAKHLGMKTVGCQQGGHEGYEDDYVAGNEMEYPYFDTFLSWGWTRFADNIKWQVPLSHPLPSPWLAIRKKRWSSILDLKISQFDQKPYDFLLMPNKIYPYPPAPSGGAVSRIDHIQGFSNLLKEFVSNAVHRGYRILHKPFNQMTVSLLKHTHQELERLGGNNYRCLSHLEKRTTRLHNHTLQTT